MGTLFCGLATSYPLLLAARIVTGLFGGVIGSVVFAITTDLFPLSMRGRVMGALQTSFAASQVLGIPFGLYLANHGGWHLPFFMIVAVSVAVGGLILVYLRPINDHLKLQKPGQNPIKHLFVTVSQRRYLIAFASTALLSVGGFMIMPFSTAFMVGNLKIASDQLPFVYITTGVAALFAGPMIGRASDKFGKFNMFCFGASMTILMVLVYTHLTGPTSLGMVLVINVLLFIGIFSRMIPATALSSAIPRPADRGAFMAVGSSVQQVSGGIASVLAGLIVSQSADGSINHFPEVGYVVCCTTLLTVGMMFWIHRIIQSDRPATATAAPDIARLGASEQKLVTRAEAEIPS